VTVFPQQAQSARCKLIRVVIGLIVVALRSTPRAPQAYLPLPPQKDTGCEVMR
jgi:hypothetical protein